MRDITDIAIRLRDKIPTNISDYSVLTSDLNRLIGDCTYRSPELIISDGYWNRLQNILLQYQDKYWNQMWYCEVMSIFTTRSYDEIVVMLRSDHESKSD